MSQTFYSSEYDPNCEFCRSGVHQHQSQFQINQNTQFNNGLYGQQSPPFNRQNLTQASPIQLASPQYLQQSPQVVQQGVVNHGIVYSTPSKIVSQRVMTPPKQSIQQPIQQPIYQQPVQYIQQPIVQPVQYQPQPQQITHVHNVEHVPVVHELHHVHRNVAVVNVEEIEAPWRTKVIKLERQMLELELLLKKQPKGGPAPIQKEVVVQDKPKIDDLQKQIKDLKDQLQDLNNQIGQAQDELNDAHENLESEQANDGDLRAGMEKQIKDTKDAFRQLNSDHHERNQEKTMAEAELDSIKNKVVTAVTTSQVQRSAVKSSAAGGASSSKGQDNLRGSSLYKS